MDRTQLQTLLQRSGHLQKHIVHILHCIEPPENGVLDTIWPMLVIVQEHAAALRLLIEQGMGNSALSLMRVLYDAVVRQMWAGYCATPEQLKLLNSTMSQVTFQNSLKLPGTHKMLEQLEKDGPEPLFRQLNEFRTYSSKPLNSVVHSSLHALSIARSGLPAVVADTIVKQSNNLLHMSGYQITLLTQCVEAHEAMLAISKEFEDCLQLKAE
jgi:hypothetical protein